VSRGRGSSRGLVVAVVLVAAAVAAALAAVVFLLVRDARLRDSVERARAEVVFDLRLAGPLLEGSTDLRQVVHTFQDERGIHAILVADGETIDSDPTPGVTVPAGLRDIAASGRIGYDRIEAGGVPTLVVGGPTPDRGAELYFAFPEAGIHDDLRELATALAIGWVAIVVVSFALARVAASRIATLAEAEAWGRRFTSDVSHELRTPVAALVSEASVLQEHLAAMPPDARRAAELLVGDVARLRRLVEDLTNLASLDAGREHVRTEPFDLATLVDGTVRSRGWDERVLVRSEPAPVTSDRTRVDRIVANLIGNALDHGGADVVVRVGRDADGASVEVADNGRGIPPEHLPHVFDRFYRADPARSGPGSGLGLAIARENARLLGGDVEARSEPGTGSHFTLRLPADAVAEP
jgi:two-component system, OmpR family, sensor histidine kinase MtrB